MPLAVKRATMSLYSRLVRPLLFRLDAETAHAWTVEACRIAARTPGGAWCAKRLFERRWPELESEVAGLRFANPVGLAAGWDKSGRALGMLDRLGFGFAEIGSISAEPSLGNPGPRLFRLPQDRAIVVNYGLPNEGAGVVAERLQRSPLRIPIGANVVSTNFGPTAPERPAEEILADYAYSVERIHRHVSYLTLNLSCPNAEGGKDLFAEPGGIQSLLERLEPLGIACPIFLKVPPEESPTEQERWLREAELFPFVRGFQFNLPRGKPADLDLKTPPEVWRSMPGAVAGRPVEERINRCIKGLYSRMDRTRFAIIAAGGVFTAEDAYRKIRLGASLVQIYTSFVYEGPGVVRRINAGLTRLLRRDGFSALHEAVGQGE